jgi:hypothetical protein
MATSALARVAVAFVIAPAFGFLALTAGMCAVQSEPFAACLWTFFPLMTIYGAPLALPTAIALAAVLFATFRRRASFNWWQVAGAGVICGVAGPVPVLLLGAPLQEWLLYVALFAIAGFVAGLAFWFLGVYRNAL